MKQIIKRGVSILLAMCLLVTMSVSAFAASSADLKSLVTKSAENMVSAVRNPQAGSIGGEWAVLGLARSGCAVPEGYFEGYYATIEAYVKACGGVLHEKKYTEYSRVIIALTSIGKNPADVAGYNLLTPLGDYEKTIWQGLNGPIWALIALDSGNYPMPQNPQAATQATRDMYVDRILACQLNDGGWNLTTQGGEGAADTDMTGMALQALAKYTDRKDVAAAVEKGLACLSALQNSSGGFSSWGTSNSESCVQVIVALCELGVDLNDSRFVKNGKTLLDNLLSFRNSDGSFKHTYEGSGSNQMATEQGFYGLVAAWRSQEGKNSLYRMSDAINIGSSAETQKGSGLPGKHEDVKTVPITKPGTTFEDVMYSDSITAIESLAARDIINGMGGGLFAPEATMTRAQFAAIVVKALGLTPKANGKFADVASTAWYAGFVGTANTYGIVSGRSETSFDPEGTITRQEAAVMVAKAAKLCGLDISMTSSMTRDMLAQFGDYRTIASWAQEAMAFCYDTDILDQSALNAEPVRAIRRDEIAQMIFNLLNVANLM
ncbi:MAG: S-layer homology domain-containing protein [Clostridia bacterium]|nr:S-layer homology domain-containing protein [Clostridia bacterium]